MSALSVFHETLVFERTYKASPERVFQAWADPEARARWSAPSETAVMEFDKFEFRLGGEEISRCGARGDLRYRAVAHYLDIAPGARIIMSERVSEHDRLIGCALVTITLRAEGGGTLLTVTDQTVSIGDRFYVEGSLEGWNAALNNLAREVEQ